MLMMDDFNFADGEVRKEELQSVGYIYPNAEIDFNQHIVSLDVPLKSEESLSLSLIVSGVERMSSSVNNLPPIKVTIALPDSYPFETPPKVEIVSEVVTSSQLDELLRKANALWQDIHVQCVYSIIDLINDFAQNEVKNLELKVTDPLLYDKIVQYNDKVLQEEFSQRVFMCDICQSDFRGASCVRFDCAHVFCKDCVGGYFSDMIENGEITKVHCPSYECVVEIDRQRKFFSKMENWVSFVDENKDSTSVIESNMKMLLVPPVSAELLRSVITEDTEQKVKKYLELYAKDQYEFMAQILPNRLVECPKPTCKEMIFRTDMSDRLCKCTKCKYAFCYDCRKSYHTRFKECKKVESEGPLFHGIPESVLVRYKELDKDSHERKLLHVRYGFAGINKSMKAYDSELLLREYLKSATDMKSCPSCQVLIEKSSGCNKMVCKSCMSSFCFLCGSIIENNYDHFSDKESSCFELLFLGMPGT